MLKNKLYALLMIAIGIAVTALSYDSALQSYDGTALLFISIFAVPVFFSKKECFI